MLAFDSEITGLDFRHGCCPFSFQFCDDKGGITFIEWDVNPLTRSVEIIPEELDLIVDKLGSDEIVGHNVKTELRSIDTALKFCPRPYKVEWNFDDIWDTLIDSHVINNLDSHGLKDLRELWMDVDRTKQTKLKLATDKARRICRRADFISQYGQWSIAREEHPHWPAIKSSPKEGDKKIEGWWLFDTWLPKAIAKYAPEWVPEGEDWDTVLKDYAVEDVETTLVLFDAQRELITQLGLVEVAEVRRKLIGVTYRTENAGVTINRQWLQDEQLRLAIDSIDHLKICQRIAGCEININSPKQLGELLYATWGMTAPFKTEKGADSVNAKSIKTLAESEEGEKKEFLTSLIQTKRSQKTADTLKSLNLWSVPYAGDWVKIHQNINITGTKFTRQSSNSPNLQNQSTGKEDEAGEVDFISRYVFGPLPGREWLSIDFQSIEYMIWGWSTGNKEIREVYHSGVSPFKPIMEAVWGFWDKSSPKYKPTKNGVYSMIYGSSRFNSDLTFGRQGAADLVYLRMPEIRDFQNRLERDLRRKGYIETLGGYRLKVPPNEPHKASSAFVQGHAGWVIGLSMIEVDSFLQRCTKTIRIILQIHDELIIDGPVGFAKQYSGTIREIMRKCGERYEIPTPTNASLIRERWSESEEIK